MKIIYKNINEVNPYVNNPRNNEESVDAVANSIKEFGWKVPCVIDKNGVLVTGHTRLKAAKKLGLTEIPCIIADDLTDEQIKAYRLADNRVGESSTWDLTKLKVELDSISDDLNMEDFNFLEEDLQELEASSFPKCKKNEVDNYSKKIDIPQYQITGANPSLSDMVDTTKYDQLMEEINNNKTLSKDDRRLLELAATRHIVFNYANIAEHYAHADKDTQELMENSALVIIDFDNALKNGYVKLDKKLKGILNASDDDEDEEE